MASLKLSGFVQNPVTGAGVPGARVYVFGRDNLGNKVATTSAYDDTEVTGRYEVTVDTAVVQTQSGKGYWIEFTNVVAPNQTRIIRTDVEFQVKYIHGLQDAYDLIPAPLMDGSIKTDMLANADASKGRGISLNKMQPDSVGTLQLLNGSVTYAKLHSDVLTGLDPRFVNTTGDTMSGDLLLYRAAQPTVGYLYLGNNGGNRYLGYDGSNYVFQGTNLYVNGGLVWTELNDGHYPGGNGPDADRLDGSHASAFAVAGHNHDTAYDARYVNTSGSEIMTGPLQVGADATARVTAEIMATRAATPSHGLVYFGTSGTRWLLWDGSNYSFNGVANLYVNGGVVWHSNNLTPSSYLPLTGGTITSNLTVNGVMNAGALQQQGAAVSLTTHDHAGQYLPAAGTAADSNKLGGQGIGYFSPASHGHGYALSNHTHTADPTTFYPMVRAAYGVYGGSGGQQTLTSANGVPFGSYALFFMITEHTTGTVWVMNNVCQGSGLIPGSGPGSDEVFSCAPYFVIQPTLANITVGIGSPTFGASNLGSTYHWTYLYATSP